MYQRPVISEIIRRMKEPKRFIQVLAGPRQTGKTTLARQLIQNLDMPSVYASADAPSLKEGFWIEQQWERARVESNQNGALLVLDEVQKLPNWSESVKRLWDEDTHKETNLRVLLLGSAPLLMQKGLGDSLAGRFESIPVTHWPYAEMRDAFDWSLEEYLFYGGYPGAAQLIHEPERWRRYILDSLLETSISRDVFLMTRVDKPALLRRLFHLACEYSGRILSYQKMLGQLQDVGNTTTLAHYLSLLESAGLVMGLQKYAGQSVRRRASSPKLLVLNTALMTATSGLSMEEAREDTAWWGDLVESCVGAYLANSCRGTDMELYYWLGRNLEVDFVLRRGKKLIGIEVKSGRRKDTLPGMQQFAKEFPVTKKLLVGGDGIALEVFFATPAQEWSA